MKYKVMDTDGFRIFHGFLKVGISCPDASFDKLDYVSEFGTKAVRSRRNFGHLKTDFNG